MPANVLAAISEPNLNYGSGCPVRLVTMKLPLNNLKLRQFSRKPLLPSITTCWQWKSLTDVASRATSCALFHEKFKGVNGSGKHYNWSLSHWHWENLLDPTRANRKKTINFVDSLVSILQGLKGTFRSFTCINCVLVNEHRLGANEAPPSVFPPSWVNNWMRFWIPLKTRPMCQQVKPRYQARQFGWKFNWFESIHFTRCSWFNWSQSLHPRWLSLVTSLNSVPLGSAIPLSFPVAMLNAIACPLVLKITSALIARK